MKISILFVIVTILLPASQLRAQAPVTSVEKTAQEAERLGHALPIMPAPRAQGEARSFAWVVGQITPLGQPPTRPANCNQVVNGHYLFCPPALQIAYGTPDIIGANGGAGTTIAIVDAFHYARAEADLNTFSNDMSLPACTKQNGCFKNVDQNGGTSYCGADSNWEAETMLDVEWAHAMAPNAKIVLVEGCNANTNNLNAAIKTAVTKEGANFVSNSWGGNEFPSETQYDSTYNLSVPLLFASGDRGSSQFPCESPYVTCVGGTALQVDSNFHRTSETAWTESGGGCSNYEAAPAFQADNGINLCASQRAAPDVAAVADPNTGVAVYDSGNGGYLAVGGTSLATPVLAGIYADVEAARIAFSQSRFGQMGNTLYEQYSRDYPYYYYDVTSGCNDYHCSEQGYDLVTGLGVSYGANMVAARSRFVAVTPCRVVDTRDANGTFGGPSIPGGDSRDFPISQGACNIPATALAYSLNITVVPHGPLGYLTAWPSGQSRPLVSTLNSNDGRVKANAAIVPAGTGTAISIYASDTTDVILDINGYFEPTTYNAALAFYPVTPCRVVDTRNPQGALGGPYIQGDSSREFPVLSSSCGLPVTAQAYSLNFTAVPHGPLGYLTVWPSDQSQPLVSTLNAYTGQVTANAAIVPAASNGDISAFVTNDSDLVIDVNGYFAPFVSGGLSLYSMLPCRVLDTRGGMGPFQGQLRDNVESSPCQPPGSARAYVLNATVVPQGGLGFLALWPDGQAQPWVSTLNASDGAVTSNMAIVPTSNGWIDAYASSLTDLIFDISSYFAQ